MDTSNWTRDDWHAYWEEQRIADEKRRVTASLKATREYQMKACQAKLDKYRNQADFGLTTDMSFDEAKTWALYLQELRDLAIADDAAVTDVTWPGRPDGKEVVIIG